MRHYFIIFLVLSLFSCSEKTAETSKEQPDISSGDTLVNQYAKAFRIIEKELYTEVQVLEPSNDSVCFVYGIGEKVPEPITDLGPSIQSIAALSSTHVGMLKKLQLADKILGVSSSDYLCGSDEQPDWIQFGELGQADPEIYIKHTPDLIMYSGFKRDIPILKKLRHAGIESMVNYDWKETHPLGRAEWLKVFGVLFQCEKSARREFEAIEESYVTAMKKSAMISDVPSVFVGTIYGDVFNVPAGDSYMSKLLKDANAEYVYKDTKGTGSLSLTLEEAITENQTTDYWLNVAASSKKAVRQLNTNFTQLKSYQDNTIYTYLDRVNCFWEESAVAPHKVLKDLIRIFHPEVMESKDYYFYEKVAD